MYSGHRLNSRQDSPCSCKTIHAPIRCHYTMASQIHSHIKYGMRKVFKEDEQGRPPRPEENQPVQL